MCVGNWRFFLKEKGRLDGRMWLVFEFLPDIPISPCSKKLSDYYYLSLNRIKKQLLYIRCWLRILTLS